LSDDSNPYDLCQTIILTIGEKKPESVGQLVAFIQQQSPISEEIILKTILKLENQGKMRFNNNTPPILSNLSTYMTTPQAIWYWITLSIVIITVLTFFLVPEDTYPLSYLRNALGLVFIIWLPGYTCTKALFPVTVPFKITPKNIGSIERIALSLGISLVLTPTLGLLLNYTPFGIRLVPITISLLILTVALGTVGVFREFKVNATATNSSPGISRLN
jgi:hypothetical protein